MNQTLREAAKRVFEDIIERPVEERPEILLTNCGRDTELRAEVESLLAAHERSGEFLQISLLEKASLVPQTLLHLPDRIGAYELVREIGHGGMAAIYLARRIDGLFEKEVALKVLDRAHSSPDLERRFRSEINALSRVEHPNIVRLFDGGMTTQGLFFMVMEYVEGNTLDVYFRQDAPSLPDRIKVFQSVCEAVSFAHRNLIVHQDLKPSNILVTPSGIPKLLDFGVAKLLDENGGQGRTTGALRRVTLDYASPEQLRGAGGISTSSDVYSLGVILYELVTGRLPHPAKNELPHEVARSIIEDEPTRPRRVMPAIPADLEAILLMTLRKEPERRYASADYLRDDLGRYLSGHPVIAFRDSFWYRARKFWVRKKPAVAVVGLSLLAVLVAAGTALFQAQKAKTRAREVQDIADVIARGTENRLWGVRGALPAKLFMTQKRVDLLESLLRDSPNDDVLKRQLIAALFSLGSHLGDPEYISAGDTAGAQRRFERAVVLAEGLIRRNPQNETDLGTLSHALNYLAKNARERGDAEEAKRLLERSIGLQKTATDDLERQIALAHSHDIYGESMSAAGELARAQLSHETSLRIREVHAQKITEYGQQIRMRRFLSIALYHYASSLHQLGLDAKALPLIERALDHEDQLSRINPEHIASRQYLAHRLTLAARVNAALKRWPVAQEIANRAVSECRSLVKDEPSSLRLVRDLAQALGTLAAVRAAAVDRSAATTLLREQISLAGNAAAKDWANARAKAEVERAKTELARLTSSVGSP